MISGNRACNKYIHVNQHYDLVILWQRLLQSKSTYYQQEYILATNHTTKHA